MKVMKAVAVAAACCAIAASATLPAVGVASPSAASVRHFTAHVTPNKNVKVGQKLRVSTTHATPNTLYICALGIANLKTGSHYGDVASGITVKSSRKGALRCTVKDVKFHGADNTTMKVRHCPLTKRDAKAGYQCGVAVIDAGTFGNTSAAFATFRAHGSKKR